jgi:hypothetical protein
MSDYALKETRRMGSLVMYFDRVEGLPSALQQYSQRLAIHGPASRMSMLLCLCDDT